MPELELRSDYKAQDVFLHHTLLLYGNVVDLPQLDTFFQGPDGLACEASDCHCCEVLRMVQR